jgi:hypothetical protein
MKYASTLFLFSLLFSQTFAHTSNHGKGTKKSSSKRITSLYGRGTSDDPDAAAAYEYTRLKNPKTGSIPKDMRAKELLYASTLPKVDENNRAGSLLWQNRGPINLGGRTRAFAIDVANENTILAGQASGGMWRSSDGGAHFTKTTRPEQIHSTTCVAQDKRTGKTNVWYYGTGEEYAIVNAAGFSSQFSGNGIFKSTNNGQSWDLLPATVSNTPTTMYQRHDFDFVWELITDNTRTDSDLVYAAVVNGIWRSADGGTTWTEALGLDSSNPGISRYTDLSITSAGVIYATVSSGTPAKGIYRSTDGITWKNITPSGFPRTYDRIEIGIAPSDETQVYFIAESGDTSAARTGHSLWHYKYLSGDGTAAGGQWENRSANIPNDHCFGFYTYDFAKFSSQNSYDLYIAVKPDDPNTVFLGGTNIYRSTNGFTTPAYTWIGGYNCDAAKPSNYVYPNHHPDQHKMLFLPSNSAVALSANDGGIYRTENILQDTVKWKSLNNNYRTGQFYTCAIEPGNTNSDIIAGGLQDNGTMFTNTKDYYQKWLHVFYGDGGYASVTHNRTNYYFSWQGGKIFKFDMTDNGTVNGLTRIDPPGIAETEYQFIAPFILDPNNDSIMYLPAGKKIFRQDSLTAIPLIGDEYNAYAPGWNFLTNATGSNDISTLDMSEANSNRLYFGTVDGKVFRIDSCKNNNAYRVNITGSNFPTSGYVSCVEVDNFDANKVLVSFSNYGIKSIFYSEDSGKNWIDVGGNLEENSDGTGNGPSVPWVHIYNDGSRVKYFAGTSTGLYSTELLDGANTVWQQEGSTSIGNVVINMITSRKYDQNIVVATHGNGVYSTKIFSANGIQETNLNDWKLNCYPNPSSDISTIDITATEGTKFTLEIFDLTGRKVWMKDLKMNTKNEKINWNGVNSNGSKCAAGQYLLQLNDGTKKSTLLIERM